AGPTRESNEVEETRRLVNVLPPSVELASSASVMMLRGSRRRSRNSTSTRPSPPTATLGRYWLVPSFIGSSLTRTGADHVFPPSEDFFTNTSSSPFRPSIHVV